MFTFFCFILEQKDLLLNVERISNMRRDKKNCFALLDSDKWVESAKIEKERL